MTNLRRYWHPGQLYFLTHVTYDRIPMLTEHADLLNASIEIQCTKSPFEIVAWVFLPDHWHLIIDPMSNDVSLLMQRIKLSFSTRLRKIHHTDSGRIWQNRFWDHILRDQNDINRHIDYIHYNPVKHRYVSDAFDWSHSSLHEYFTRGLYQRDWGVTKHMEMTGEFGE